MTNLIQKLKSAVMWIAGGALAIAGTLLVLAKLKEKQPEAPAPALPPASVGTEAAVQAAEVKAAGEVAAASATAEVKVAALNDVAATDSDAERRKQLADLANKA